MSCVCFKVSTDFVDEDRRSSSNLFGFGCAIFGRPAVEGGLGQHAAAVLRALDRGRAPVRRGGPVQQRPVQLEGKVRAASFLFLLEFCLVK